jgi:RecG-like helicase
MKILKKFFNLKLDLNFLNPNKNKIKLIDLNDEIKNYLKENQKKAIEFFLKNLFEKKIYKNLLLGEPGSGKTNVFTLISLIVLNKMENIKIIIISPKSNLYQIKSEYENLFKNFNILV